MKRESLVGKTVGKNEALLVLEEVRKYKETTRLIVECQICKLKPQLYGEAIYRTTNSDIRKGSLPCGCARNPKHGPKLWINRINEHCKLKNYNFHGFVREFKGQNTKLKLSCNVCDHRWDSCTAGNFLNKRSCPNCADIARGLAKRKDDEVMIASFFSTGLFKDGTEFIRDENETRMWNVICPVCKPKVFRSDKSNLQAGKVPCDCSNGGGFDKTKPAYFYVLKCSSETTQFCGFGITNHYHRRIVNHTRNLAVAGYKIDEQRSFSLDGQAALDLENFIKQNLPRLNTGVSGFIREATAVENHDTVIAHAEQAVLYSKDQQRKDDS